MCTNGKRDFTWNLINLLLPRYDLRHFLGVKHQVNNCMSLPSFEQTELLIIIIMIFNDDQHLTLLTCRGLHCSDLYNFRAERCTDAPANSIFSGPMTHLLSVLCVSVKILSHASAKKKTKRLKDFKFRTFIGGFQVTSLQ